MFKRIVNKTDIVVLPLLNLLGFVRLDGCITTLGLGSRLYFKRLSNVIELKAVNCTDLFVVFWTLLMSNYKSRLVYFAEVNIVGLGYRIRVIGRTIFRLFLGKTNYIYVFVPGDLFLRSVSNDMTKIRKILIGGLNCHKVKLCLAAILLLRPLNPYRITGILDPRKFIFLKTGKRR